MPSVKMHRVLITGAGGRIDRGLRETLRGVYPILRLSDLDAHATGESRRCGCLGKQPVAHFGIAQGGKPLRKRQCRHQQC
jgi:hypothetical protein